MKNKRTDIGLGGSLGREREKGRESNVTEADWQREDSAAPNSTVEYMWYGQLANACIIYRMNELWHLIQQVLRAKN